MKFFQNKFLNTVCLVVLGILLVSSSLMAEETTVCKSGCQYIELSSAITDADSGDKIKIGQGTFEVNLQINKRIKLIGSGENKTIFTSAKEEMPIIYLGSKRVTLDVKNLTIKNTIPKTGFGQMDLCANEKRNLCPYGISVVGESKLKLESVTISGTPIGVSLARQGKISALNCNFIDNDTGIYLADSATGHLNQCKLSDNFMGINITGEQMNDSKVRLKIVDTTIKNNMAYGIQLGGISAIYGNSPQPIQAKVVDSVLAENGNGNIMVYSGVKVKSSEITWSERGIEIGPAATLVLNSCNVSNNKAYGIMLELKQCNYSGFTSQQRDFKGMVKGSNNKFIGNSVCPEELELLTSEKGGEYTGE